MNQVLLANNDCDQSGPGDNLASAGTKPLILLTRYGNKAGKRC